MTAPKTLEFETVDVFTDQAFGGNPLAVVFGGEDLSTQAMQNIAAEFNLSETTFVLPPPRPDLTAQVRIFTPVKELPFAGHPNVGTAFVLARRGEVFGRRVADRVVFAEQAGDVPIAILSRDGAITGAELKAPQPMVLGQALPVEAIARCCGLEPADILTTNHGPGVVSCGVPFALAEVASRDALRRAVPMTEVMRGELPVDLAPGLYLYTLDADPGADIDARMFAPLVGVSEDPATGSAAVTLAARLATLTADGDGPAGDASVSVRIRQGVDMGRSGLMAARAEYRSGREIGAWIGGDCVPMMHGTLQWS